MIAVVIRMDAAIFYYSDNFLSSILYNKNRI
jgi:hypothetical protein